MEGNLRENITFTQNVKKRGYETVIPLKFNGAYLVANALDKNGKVMATTDVWDLALGATVSNWRHTPNPPSPSRTTSLPVYLLPCHHICGSISTDAFISPIKA